ncbi:Acetyltransferase (GNAT) family protein [Clostridium gasigenes]|uniref:Acetyltransferase (GNAT) family protein n=2 Tax=Clostridium gasigenes TaxID=94869 RepID=A0A1H0UE58_9CLOT|nr:Acetyltransferase (GNAT) family protein [Clostridium gasigenes]
MTYKISALSVIPEYQNRGIAKEALKQIENYYPNASKWILDTIFQEKGNCHLYEKLGYVKVGELRLINERMTLVNYVKICK